MHRPSSDLDFMRKVFHFYGGEEKGERLFLALEWAEADVLDPLALESAFRDAEEVYHCAALVSYSSRDAQKLLLTNAEGTANVVNAALEAGVQRLCHISSVSTLGKGKGKPVDENTPVKRSELRSIYGKSKYLAEREVWRGAAEGLQAFMVNPSVILGPAKADQSSGMFMNMLLEGPFYYPPGGTGLVDVRDVSACCRALMRAGHFGERFLLNAVNASYRDILHSAASIFGHKPPTFAVQAWMLEMLWPLAAVGSAFTARSPRLSKELARNAARSLSYSNEKVLSALDFSFAPLEDSLRYYKDFYL